MVADVTNPAPDAPACGAGSRAALVVLVALVVLSPWAFGSVDPWAVRTITLVSLATALFAFVWDAKGGRHHESPIPLWPLAGLWLLGVLQLVPIPAALHKLIAPGSAAIWHPDVPAAAAVLGPGPHPISVYPEATRRTLAFGTGVIALVLAAVPALRIRRNLLTGTVTIVAGGVAVALYGLVARLVFGNKIYGIWSVPTVAPFGPFVSKNHFAGYVELAALLAVGLATGLASEARKGPGFLSWIDSSRARHVVLAWGAAAVLILAVPVSLSRGGVVSLTAGLLAFVALRLWARRERPLPQRMLLLAGSAVALLLAGLVAALPSEARLRMLTLAGITSEQSGSYRLGVWRDTLTLVASSPAVGSGLGAYEDAVRRFKTQAGHLAVEHAESDGLELLAESGLAGLLVVLAVLVLVLLCSLRVVSGPSPPLTRALTAGAAAALVALAVHSIFDFNLRIPSNALLAAALPAAALAASATETAHPTWRRQLPAVFVAATLALTPLTPWSVRRVSPGPLLRAANGEATLRRTGLEAALVFHVRARPADAPAWLALAWLRTAAAGREARGLAAWAARLDPQSETIRAAQARLQTLGSPD
jgi:O-antigen ligase